MNKDPSANTGNRRLFRAVAPLIAVAALSACATGERPQLSDEVMVENTGEQPLAKSTPTSDVYDQPPAPVVDNLIESYDEETRQFQEYMNSESRNDEIGDFVSNSVKSLYNILQQSKDMSLSIIVGGSEADNKHSSPFLLMEGTLDGEHYRIISFGDSVDASPNYFTGDSGDSISFEPKTIMISTYPEEFADELPEVKSMPDAFIGLSSGTGNYVLSYSDLELGDDSVYYDSTRITDDGVESSKIDVDLRSGKGSGPDPSVQKTLNVEEYTKSKVSNTIDRIKWILGGRITVPEGNIHEEIDPEK